MRVKIAELKDKLLFEVFTAFCVSLLQGKIADCQFLVEWLGGLKLRETGLIRSIFVVFFNITKMFAKAVCRFSHYFSYAELFAHTAGYTVGQWY